MSYVKCLLYHKCLTFVTHPYKGINFQMSTFRSCFGVTRRSVSISVLRKKGWRPVAFLDRKQELRKETEDPDYTTVFRLVPGRYYERPAREKKTIDLLCRGSSTKNHKKVGSALNKHFQILPSLSGRAEPVSTD